MNGTRPRRGGRKNAAAALSLAAALLLAAGCGARSISVGSTPFPAKKPIFAGDGGKTEAGLPPSSEPVLLVFIDAPWCPPCSEAWDALESASSTFAPGFVHVIRILFDRERIYGQGGEREAPPLRPSATPGTTFYPPDAPRIRVTTLVALPGPFRREFRVDQVPVILLMDEGGRVEARWTGHSPSLRDQLAEAVGRRAEPTPPDGT